MPDVVIENPVINSPYEEPRRHFVFADDGITDEIAQTRRLSSYFIPIPPPKKKGGQQVLSGDWLGERMMSNDFINRVRGGVGRWRQGDLPRRPQPHPQRLRPDAQQHLRPRPEPVGRG